MRRQARETKREIATSKTSIQKFRPAAHFKPRFARYDGQKTRIIGGVLSKPPPCSHRTALCFRIPLTRMNYAFARRDDQPYFTLFPRPWISRSLVGVASLKSAAANGVFSCKVNGGKGGRSARAHEARSRGPCKLFIRNMGRCFENFCAFGAQPQDPEGGDVDL